MKPSSPPPSSDAESSARGIPGAVSVVLGRADEMRSDVYVRFAESTLGARRRPVQLSGTLTGPRCRHSTTLASSVRLTDLGPAPGDDRSAAARAVVTEPSYWTPDLPHLYELELAVLEGDGPIESFHRMIGLRRLGVRNRSLWLDGRRWVPRGTAMEAADFDGPSLRAATVAAVIVDPPVDVCARADQDGIAVIAVLDTPSGSQAVVEHAIERVAAWSLHASVVVAVVPLGCPASSVACVADRCRSIKGTMLLGMEVEGSQPPATFLPKGIDCLMVRLRGDRMPHSQWRDAPPRLPLVAWRSAGPHAGVGRLACDRLQAELAAWGTTVDAAAGGAVVNDWAGYVVA